MARRFAWWAALVIVAGPLHAQHRSPVAATPASREPLVECERQRPDRSLHCTSPGRSQGTGSPAGNTAWSIAASALLPGSGQALLSVNRAIPYLAVEAFAWTGYVRNAQDYRRSRDGYRDLAARVARSPFSTVRPHGDFEYYERMTHYLEAGRYDLVAGGGLDPETDSTTYNGAVWLLARRTFWADPTVAPHPDSPEWQRAVAFYRARAYDQAFRWSWTQAPEEYSAFLRLIRSSNAANRRALQDLGVIIANHVLSTVDAYITVRLRRRPGAGGFALEGAVPMETLLRRN